MPEHLLEGPHEGKADLRQPTADAQMPSFRQPSSDGEQMCGVVQKKGAGWQATVRMCYANFFFKMKLKKKGISVGRQTGTSWELQPRWLESVAVSRSFFGCCFECGK